MYDVIIIGGGPSGVMCGIELSKRNKKVAIIDSNHQLLRKFRLTGNGRSNILNYSDQDEYLKYMHNHKFLYTSINKCSPKFLYAYFEKMGIKLKIEDHNRVYPVCDNASTVAEILIKQLKNVDIIYNETVIKISDNFKVYTNEHSYYGKKVVIATGGVSYPTTGSKGIGHQLAQSYNHKITALFPVETPIISNAPFIQQKTLQGISLSNIKLSVISKNKIKDTYTHDLLFTHFGISGPVSLGVSETVYLLLSQQQKVFVELDFLPNYSYENLKALIKNTNNLDNTLKNTFKNILPYKLLIFLLNNINVNENTKINTLSNALLEQLLTIIKKFQFPVHDVKPIQYAFVTGGGINTKEINPHTYESKLVPNLYFIGEIVDIHGKIGGYNLTYCFMSGYIVGNSI